MTKTQFRVKDIILCALFSALVAVGAFIKIPLLWVPFSLQFLFANLAGLLLGSKRGAIAVTVYIILGLFGIPVFTGGGGPAYILKPTFGYLIGFILGTYMTGLIAQKGKSYGHYVIASLIGLAIVYSCGMLYYYFICNFYLGTPIGISKVLIYCCAVFLPSDITFCFLGAFIKKRLEGKL